MKTALVLLVVSGAILLAGCGEKEVSGPPEAWTKLDDSAKLEKIKHMPLSAQQKADAIQKLNVPDGEKRQAIADVNSGGNPPPSNPAPSGG